MAILAPTQFPLRTRPRFKLGDRVRFPYVLRSLEGVIQEDRGNIGVGGRRLYVIAVEVDPSQNSEGTLYYTRAESDLTAL